MKLSLFTFATSVIGAAVFTTNVYALDIGSPMPKLTEKLQNLNGKESTLDSFAGKKGTLVIFSCNHCPYVKKWAKRMTTIGNRVMSEGFGVVVINSNDAEKYPDDNLAAMNEFAKEHGQKFAYVADRTSNFARTFGATRTPEVFLFDSKGKLAYTGAIDDNPEVGDVKVRHLDVALAAVAKNEKVPLPTTKSVGCSIKFRDNKASANRK